MHAPAAVGEFESFGGDEMSCKVLHVRILLAPPALKVGLLHVSELATGHTVESEDH